MTVGPLATAFESELGAWLAWLRAARLARDEQCAMRRLELVYGIGWTGVGAAVVSIPLLEAAAAVLSVIVLLATLVIGCLATAADCPSATAEAIDTSLPRQGLGPAERARLVRVMNLSRVASRQAGAKLLLSEVDEALAAERLAGWPPLRDLRDLLLAGSWHVLPFDPEPVRSGGGPRR